jgi:hypothetical protein
MDVQMRNRLASSLVVPTIVAVLAIGGCGGGDDSSTTTGASGTALTKEEFLEQGNAICAEGNKPIDAEIASLNTGQPLTDAQIQEFADVLIPSVQGQIDDIRALPPPEGDEDTVGKFLDTAQTELDRVKDDPSVLASDSQDPFEETNQLANDYGLTDCGG